MFSTNIANSIITVTDIAEVGPLGDGGVLPAGGQGAPSWDDDQPIHGPHQPAGGQVPIGFYQVYRPATVCGIL